MKKDIVTFVDFANNGIPFPLVPPFELGKIPIPIDILDSLIVKYLPGRCRGWIEFDRKEITPVSIQYITHLPDLGQLGSIEIYKSADKESTMNVTTPPLSTRSEEMEKVAKRHNTDVIKALFSLLAEDATWKDYWRSAGLLWAKNRPRTFVNKIHERITLKNVLGVILFILGVLISIAANVASANFPESLRPILWISWPLLLILTIISAILIFFQ